MELKHIQAKRLHARLCAVAGKEAADRLLADLPLSASPTDTRKAEWACRSCAALHACLDDEAFDTVRRGCHCKPSPASVKRMKALWDASADAADFAAKATEGASGAFTLEAEDGALLLTYPVCYCPFIKRATAEAPADWCVCSLGYADDMYAQVTGRPVHSELVESVVTGADRCRIRVRLL